MDDLQTTQVQVPEGVIDFGVGQPDISLLPLKSLRAASEHWFSQHQSELLQYGASLGDGKFRHTLSQFLSTRYGTPVPANQLMVTTGASQALDLVCTRFTKPGDTVFVEAPTYFLALLTFRDHGLNVVGIPVDEHGLRIDALKAALAVHRPTLLYTVPTFQNPSGFTLSSARRQELLALAESHNFLVVADEVYHLLDFGTKPPAPLAISADSERVISFGSFSKICAPGLRLGWVQTSATHLNTLADAGLVESGGGLNPFTSGVMRSMITLGLLDSCLDHLRDVYARRSRVLCSALREHAPQLIFADPVGGFFVWAQLPDGRRVADVMSNAARQKVGFQQGTRFSRDDAFASHLRLCFAHYDDADLVDGAKRIARALVP